MLLYGKIKVSQHNETRNIHKSLRCRPNGRSILKGSVTMKNIQKRLTAVMSAAAVALTMCGSIPINTLLPDTMLTAGAAVSTQCNFYAGNNLNSQNYFNWANPIDSYLTAAPDGGFMRFQNGALDGKYLVEYYDSAYNIQKTVQINAELPIFGGFYETETYYFVLTGQENFDELAETECYRITKYDKDWNRLDSAGLYDCNTTIPFDAGSARFAASGSYLLIRTCHEMYTDEGGLNHQANVTIQLDMENMEITDALTAVSNRSHGYVSHSFNQFIHVENGQIISLDHGDAIPRSLALMKYSTDLSDGTFFPRSEAECRLINVVQFPDSDTYHYNYTGASVGGFEISETSYLTAYAAENYEDNNVDCGTRNIMVGVVNKETDAVTNVQITNYEEGSVSASTPHLVKVSDSCFVILWSRENNVYYTAIDAAGNPEEICTIEGASLSDCKPIVSDGKLVWYTWNGRTNIFYEIDTTDLSKHSETVIENGHKTEVISKAENPGDECAVHCTQCGQDFTFATPTDVTIWWRERGANFASTAMPQLYVGDTIVYEVEFEGGDPAFLEYEMIISDTEHITVYPISPNEAELTLLKEGKYTIEFVYPYCDAFNETELLKVNHYAGHALVKTPAEEGSYIAHMVCQDCDYTEEFTVPTAIQMLIETSDDGYLSSIPEPCYCPDADTLIGAYAMDPADNYEMTIEFSDPDMAVFTNNSNYYFDIYGLIDWQKEGMVDITIYPTYNPWVKQTLSVKIGHAYADGICTGCGLECLHDSGYADLPDCLTPGTCAECGMAIGEIDPDSHASEDVTYQPDADDAELHNVWHACCDTLKATEAHSFAADEATGGYTCICGAQAAWMLTYEDETAYFVDPDTAIVTAETIPNSLLAPLHDMSVDPFVLRSSGCVLDLNGMNLSINSVPENDCAVTVEETAKLCITDSRGGGEISAPDGMDLFVLNGGTIEIMGGTLRSDGTVIRNNGTAGVSLYGGTLIGGNGVVSEKGDVYLYGRPDFQCTDADLQLGKEAMLHAETDLHGAGYMVNHEETGAFVSLAEELTFDDTWFVNQAENRVFAEENGMIYVRCDLAKADIQLNQEEYAYSGTAIKPDITGTFEGASLEAADYEIRYTDLDGNDAEPIDPGEYRAVITGIGDFAGTMELPFRIAEPEPTITGYTYTVQPNAPQYYFSHDSEAFRPEDLIESVTRYAVYSDGTVSENGEILEDLNAVSFDGLYPEMICTEGSYVYSLSASITDEFGTQTIEEAVSVYIGAKGDADLDGKVDAIDAAAILIYAAADGAGQAAYLVSGTDAECEALAMMLANVDASAKTDANDAAYILTYAALIGSGEDADWETLIAE